MLCNETAVGMPVSKYMSCVMYGCVISWLGGGGWRLRVELVSLPCLLHLLDFCGRGKLTRTARSGSRSSTELIWLMMVTLSDVFWHFNLHWMSQPESIAALVFLIRILSHQFRLLGQKIPALFLPENFAPLSGALLVLNKMSRSRIMCED